MRRYIALSFAILLIIICPTVFARPACYCQPHEKCWPTAVEWANLNKKVAGHLLRPTSPLASCLNQENSSTCALAITNIHNPFYNENHPGATQSQGWYQAWQQSISEYAVAAQTTQDVVEAIQFAREHHLRVAIKGTGHDYLGRSNAPHSLLIWTHPLRHLSLEESFVPQGCPEGTPSTTAVTIGAGMRWLEAYNFVTTEHHRYVQGGGCASVGAAGGFPQGGGFGSYSKKFGTGAAGILQAEIVTADGKILVANACQHSDLFWAIRGGGGGTFGIVTRLTLKTHELPSTFGIMKANITARDDIAFKKLIRQFSVFYRDHLNNEHWGEQFSFNPDNSIGIFMLFQGLTQNQVNQIWMPLYDWAKLHADEFNMTHDLVMVPADKMWDYRFWQAQHPEFITMNTLPNAPKEEFWWKNNTNEVSEYWYTYQSWWLPSKLFHSSNIERLTDLFFKASRYAPVTLHINKGLAGASKEAILHTKETATNPKVLDAAALVIMGKGSHNTYPSLSGYQPNINDAAQTVKAINKAMALFTQAAPHAGAYVNEADYFMKDWQNAFWGTNYRRLYHIKQKYDPTSLFYCHHCVGSERRTPSGLCTKQ